MKKAIIWPSAHPTEVTVLDEFTDSEGTFLMVQFDDGDKLCVDKTHTQQVARPVGRPPRADKDELKSTYRIGLTAKRHAALVSHFGSLAKAVESIKLPNVAKLLVGFALLATLTSCSDRIFNCPAYNSVPKHRR